MGGSRANQKEERPIPRLRRASGVVATAMRGFALEALGKLLAGNLDGDDAIQKIRELSYGGGGGSRAP
jgi:hypothetical protein